MAFKMNGSPAKLGTIQGTSGHASALKQTGKTSEELAAARAKIIAQNEAAKEVSKIKSELRKEQEKNKKEQEKNKKEPSEKTKRLREEVDKADKETENRRLKAEAKKDKKGWFSGRKRTARKHKRAGKKEDKARERLAESEVWDTLTPDEKIAKRRQKMAYLEAMFKQDASTMANIAGVKTNEAKINQNTEDPKKGEMKKRTDFTNYFNPDANKFNYKVDVGEHDLPGQKEGEV